MDPPKVIVFGPTGGVASAASVAAHNRGAKVYLAMRNTSKAIPGLDPSLERDGRFERVEADLSKPDSVRDAVTRTGATRAFIYWVFGAVDSHRLTIEALKAGGIEHVVFLSSISIVGDVHSIPPDDTVPYAHAQIEINLSKTFGATGFTAVRPGMFASNTRSFLPGVKDGKIAITEPELKGDWIAPEDIGRVCGAILALPSPVDTPQVISLVGPELISQRDAIGLIADLVGTSIEVTAASDEEAVAFHMQDGPMPEPIARYLVKIRRDMARETPPFYQPEAFAAASANVAKYTGEAPTRLADWLPANREIFTS